MLSPKQLLAQKPSALLLLLVVFLLPFERLPSFEFHGYSVKLSYLACILCLISLLFERPLHWLRQYPITLPERALATFSAYSFVLALTIAPDRGRAVVFSLLWLFVFLMFAVTARTLAEPRRRRWAEHILLAVTAAACLFGIYQYLGDSFGLPASLTGLRPEYTKLVFGFPRIQSVALEPLYFSNYLLVPLFLAVYRLLRSKKSASYFWLVALITLNLTLGISRGAYLAAIVGGVLVGGYLLVDREACVSRVRIAGTWLAVLLGVLLAAVGIYGINGKQASSNFVGHALISDAPKEASVQDRFATDRQAWQFFLHKPVTGYGPSSFGILSMHSAAEQRRLGYGIVNNEYLELLVETGVIGAGAFLIFLISSVSRYVRTLRLLSPEDRLHSFCYFGGLVGIFVQYNFFSTLYILYIWIFLGFWFSFVYQKKADRS